MLKVVWGLIFHGNEVLIGKKREGPHPYGLGGKWHIIGGAVEKGGEALKREIKEETGLEVKNIKRLGEKVVKTLKGRKVKIVVFYCKAKSKDAKACSDLDKVKWVRKEVLLNEVCERVKDDLLSIEGVKELLK